MPKTALQEFDAFKDNYQQEIGKLISFAGQEHDFYLRVKADHLVTLCAEHKGGKPVDVLDVGCGHGFSHRFLLGRKEVKMNLAGCDPAASVIKLAQAAHPTVAYAVNEGATLPYKKAQFDVVTATCVMHHVPPAEWAAMMAEMARVLRPGGLLAIYEHNPLNPATQYIVNTCPIDENAVLLSPRTLKRLTAPLGFAKAATDYLLFTPFTAPFWRKLDKTLRRVPLGAQYVFYANKLES